MRLLAVACLVIISIGCNGEDPRENRIRHPDLTGVEEQARRSVESALGLWRTQLDEAETPDDRALAYARLGQVYLAHHFDAAASDALAFATATLPDNPHWYFYFASALEKTFRLEDSELALNASLAISDDPEVRMLRAEVRARRGDEMGALQDIKHLKDSFEAATQTENSNDSDKISIAATATTRAAWHALEAELLARIGRYSEADQSLAEAIRLSPESNALYASAAHLKSLLGEERQAQRLRRKAGKQVPVHEQPLIQALTELSRGAQYYLDRGRTWMISRQFQQAVADFAVAADIAPSSHEAQLAYARALEIVGDIDKAEPRYLMALELNSQSAIAHYFLGMLYERRMLDDKALEHYADAVTADPAYLPPRLALAHAEFRKQRYAQALQLYASFAADQEGHYEARYYAGLAALALGDCETAPQWFSQAIEVNSHSREAQVGLARSYAVCSEDPDELSQAQDIGERLEEGRPDAAAAATLAMVFAALRDFESAIKMQNLAIRRSSEDRTNGQRDRLNQYESGERAQVAWLSGDEVFEPPRLTMRVLQ